LYETVLHGKICVRIRREHLCFNRRFIGAAFYEIIRFSIRKIEFWQIFFITNPYIALQEREVPTPEHTENAIISNTAA